MTPPPSARRDSPCIGFAGLTHLGLCSSLAAATKGFAVVGFDPDPARVAGIARGEPGVVEPGLPEAMDATHDRMTVSADAGALSACDVVFIAADVATDDRGGSDLGGTRSLIDAVLPVLNPQAVLVVLCQVPPGFTRGLACPPSRLFYQVETLVFGQAIERATRPERIIVGCAEPESPQPPAYRRFLEAFDCPILPMRYESAELAKIAINMCLVASVSVANTMAELCEATNADWHEIVPALRLDRRIGAHAYLAPGLGIAGGNLERDLRTVIELGQSHGTDVGIVAAWIANSRHRRDWVLHRLHEEVLERDPTARIALWGLAYKVETASVKNSPALALLEALGPFAVRAYDPCVRAETAMHPRLVQASDPLDACRDADVLVVMTPWRQFSAVAPADIAGTLRGRLILDPYRALDGAACRAAGLRHVTLGASPPVSPPRVS